MRTTTPAADRGFDPPPLLKPSIAICVVYDDDLARDRAQRVGRHLLGELGEFVEISFSLWQADALSRPQIQELADDAAAQSDILLFSWQAGRDVAPEIAQWLDEALARRAESERVLVALLECGATVSPQPSPAAACLGRIARKANSDFLFHAEPVPRRWSALDFATTPDREFLVESSVSLSSIRIHSNKTS